jgi:predicted RNA binding protein YcfA (HicA-like mRNA interferase family)
MKSVSGRDFARIIERRGWILLRVNGSHHIYGKTDSIVRLSVPIHGNKPLKTGLLRHLAKLAELSDDDLSIEDAIAGHTTVVISFIA